MSEEFFFRSGMMNLFGSPEVWIGVAYLAGMFLVLAFRPQQITEPASFRLSYILFALYFIVPSSVNGLLFLTMLDGGSGRNGGQMTMIAFQFSGILGKVLLGLSIVFALGSMVRRRPMEYPGPRPTEPGPPA
jgi:hypothetical protein